MKTTHKRKSLALCLLTLAFVLAPIASAQTAYAATTTTKYLNGKIVFDSDRDGNSEIYTMNPDGSNVIRLTNNSATDDGPSWSPDGSKIAFHTDRDGNYEIYAMNADGSNQTRLTNNSAADTYPAWSPDGNKIAFYTYRDGNAEIYTMNADGSSITRLTTNSSADYYPRWSPNGTKLAFMSDRDGNAEIYTMNADGTNQTRLTSNTTYEGAPSWSPDGSKLAFESDHSSPPPYNEDIYTMNVDGSNITRLTNTSVLEEGAAYSPDGTKLLASVYLDAAYNSSEVYVMNSDGTQPIQLSNGGIYNFAFGAQPWQPLPYTQTTNDNGTTTSTIAASDNYSTTDYVVPSNETLSLDGTLCDVTVQSGGTLAGTGHACTITVQPGGTIAPGHSPGCLSSGNLSLSGTYTAQLAGTTPCSSYDQLQVTGTVTAGGTLNLSLLNNFTPKAGDVFTLITNDSTDLVTGTFANLPEGATITVAGSVFKISYLGGDGNDITLTAHAIPGTPNTGVMTIRTNVWAILFVTILSSAMLLVIPRRRLGRRKGGV